MPEKYFKKEADNVEAKVSQERKDEYKEKAGAVDQHIVCIEAC